MEAEGRTEEQAELGLLTVVMGGQRYTLPTLTIAQGEEWQTALVSELTKLDMPVGGTDGQAMLRAILGQGSRSKLLVLAAYDLTNVLGGAENIASKMTPLELKDNLDLILDAEFPFDGGARSVGAAFGLPLRALAAQLTLATEVLSPSVVSASGLSPTGASPIATSANGGAPSNSSSAGLMASGASRKRPKTG